MALAKVAPYGSVPSGAGNWGGTDRWFISKARQHRIRQNGTITQVKVYSQGAGNPTRFELKIWRKTGANSYDLVGSSENFATSINSGGAGVKTVTLASPISGVQEGDYIGYAVNDPGSLFASTGQATGEDSYAAANSTTPASTGYAWESQTSFLTTVLFIECYMTSPDFVIIGDSIPAGHPGHFSSAETNDSNAFDATSTIGYKLAALWGNKKYQNTGIGSQTTANIAARIAADCVNLSPAHAVLEGGVNDIAGAVSQATFIANWTTILDAVTAAGIIPVVLKILPWTNGTNANLQTRDSFNAALVSLCASYPTAKVADASSLAGQFRVGGDPGNLWDIKTADNADGVHFNAAGHQDIAQAIYNVVTAVAASGNPRIARAHVYVPAYVPARAMTDIR